MSKTPKLKKPSTSIRSRAARRAASPSIDVDKSIKDARPAPETFERASDTLGPRNGSGVSKKIKQKPMSRQQRLRREKGMARADAVIEKHETKVVKSKDKGRAIKARRTTWEDLNGDKIKHQFAALEKSAESEALELELDDVAVDDAAISKSARETILHLSTNTEAAVGSVDGII